MGLASLKKRNVEYFTILSRPNSCCDVHCAEPMEYENWCVGFQEVTLKNTFEKDKKLIEQLWAKRLISNNVFTTLKNRLEARKKEIFGNE